MSSIAGIFWRDGRLVGRGEIDRMVESLEHWGPDAIGQWSAGAAALAQLSLWSTPEAQAENAPVNAEPGLVVAADARIDNREELMAELGLRGAAAVGDVELIARAYGRWGDECPGHLLGDFAFAIWDERRRRFFCARDPMGVRPFFYVLDQNRFLFGTEIKALFTAPDVSRDLNHLQLAVALSGLPSFDDQTAFRAVRALEPASALVVEARDSRSWKYWRLEFEREIALPRDEDYVDAFEEVLRRAIKARLRATGRVGSLLSGGLDATTCLALALQEGVPGNTSAFSWALPPGDDWWVPDERRFVDAFLQEHPIDHAYVAAEPKHLFDLPLTMRRHGDSPAWRVDHAQFVPTFEAAQRRGVRVLLHGVGGDETASYAAPDYPLWKLWSGDFAALHAEAKGCAAAHRTDRIRALPSLFSTWERPARWRAPFEYQWTYTRWCQRVADLSERGIPLAREIARETDLVCYVREVAKPKIPGAGRQPLRAHQIYLLTQTHVMSDQVAAWDYAPSYRLECRCPYLDRRVLEFAVAMPARQHRFEFVNRRLLRRVALRSVPLAIAGRRDKSVSMPDLGRSIHQLAPDLLSRMEGWRADRHVRALVDLDQLASNLQRVITATETRSEKWTPVLPFCRGILLATYLAGQQH